MICNIARPGAGGSEMVSFTFTGNGTTSMTFPQLVGKKNVIVQDIHGHGYSSLWTAIILEDGFKFVDYYGTSYDHNIYLQAPGTIRSDLAAVTFDPATGTITSGDRTSQKFYGYQYIAYGW